MKRLDIIRSYYFIKFFIKGSIHLLRQGIIDIGKRCGEFIKKFWKNFSHFGYIWIVLFCIFCGAFISQINLIQWWWIKVLAYVGIAIIAIVLIATKRPMNIVYGLIGTSGSIQHFFRSFIIINLVFAGIYYCGFFAEAEISYDLNQPHIRFKKLDSPQCVQKDTFFIYSDYGNSYFLQERKKNIYQPISKWQVLRNTIMTSLIQEPTDLFDAAITHNEAMYDTTGMTTKEKNAMNDQAKFDKERSELFHSILILQILISWILLGVFISILYTKFRYDS